MQALIVMTTNAGSAAVSRGGGSGPGFQLETDGESTVEDAAYDGMKRLVTEELKVRPRPADDLFPSVGQLPGLKTLLLTRRRTSGLSC